MTIPSTLAQADPTGKPLFAYLQDGGEIGWIIVLLSIVAVALIVIQLVQVRLPRLVPPASVEALDAMLSAGDTAGAIDHCEAPENGSFLTRVVGSALVRCSRSPFGFLELRGALEEAGQREVSGLYRLTDAIGLIASVAPMLGLLGTVVGMVGAFETITMAEGAAKSDRLAGNISVALITTVLGLIVAIPCTAAYTFLRNRIDALTAEAGDTIEDLASHLEASAGQPARTA